MFIASRIKAVLLWIAILSVPAAFAWDVWLAISSSDASFFLLTLVVLFIVPPLALLLRYAIDLVIRRKSSVTLWLCILGFLCFPLAAMPFILWNFFYGFWSRQPSSIADAFLLYPLLVFPPLGIGLVVASFFVRTSKKPE